MQQYQAVIFDFDGTLADSAPGIMQTITALLRELGREELTQEQLRACVGPPMHRFFTEILGFPENEKAHAIEVYRKLFDEIALPNLRAFDGCVQLLRDLHSRGILTGVASCKMQRACIEQAKQLGLAPYLNEIAGGQPQRQLFEKADILRDVLERLGVEPQNAVMVGDRNHDLIGANAVGTASIGVLYGGCSTREELEAHNPIHIVETVAQLSDLLLSLRPVS